MKLLYHHRTRSKDGQNVHIEELIRALRDLGHEVHVVGPPGYNRDTFGADSGFIATLKRMLPFAVYEGLEIAYSVPAFFRLWAACRRDRYDALYERYNLFLLAGAWLKKLNGIPLISEVNSPLVEERERHGGLSLKRIAHWCERYVWNSADIVLPVTEALASYVRIAGVPAERILVVPNGVGDEFLNSTETGKRVRRRYRLEDKVVLGFTGFVRDWHGLDEVVRVLAQSSASEKLELLIVGDGPARPELEALATSLGVAQRVTFTGIVPRSEIAAHVAAFDIALQPRVTAYASPLKLFEYMALSRAIVAPAVPNIMEILRDGDSALLFEPQDAEGLGRAITKLAGDPDLRRRIGSSARDVLEQRRLTWKGNAQKIEALVGSMMRKPERCPRF